MNAFLKLRVFPSIQVHAVAGRIISTAIVSLVFLDQVHAVPPEPPFDIELGIGAGKPYTIIQLGNNGGDPPPTDGDKLEITSNSSVFGSTLKGKDKKGEKNKITTSKVTGAWDAEKSGINDFSSSYVGSMNAIGKSAFNAVAADALAMHAYWEAQGGTNIGINLNSGASQTITGTTGGANVFNITDGVILNSDARLLLTGGEGDFFVFNIPSNKYFSINSDSIIELGGDIEASEVLWNVSGNVGSAIDDGTLIGSGSIFQGTLLAPGRKVEVTSNHFYTFKSGGFMGTQAPRTTEVTAADAIAEKLANKSSWGGLFGQIVAGGAINFTESDISHQPFMPMPSTDPSVVPEPHSLTIFGIFALGIIAVGIRRHKQPASQRQLDRV